MEFVMGELLAMAPFFDLADEAGRSNLQRDICDLLQKEDISPAQSRTMVKCISTLEPKLETRIIKLLEVISELREPLTQAEVPLSEAELRRQKLEVCISIAIIMIINKKIDFKKIIFNISSSVLVYLKYLSHSYLFIHSYRFYLDRLHSVELS